MLLLPKLFFFLLSVPFEAFICATAKTISVSALLDVACGEYGNVFKQITAMDYIRYSSPQY